MLKRTVLLLEDDGTTRTLLGHTLAKHGYEIIEAARLSDARLLLQKVKPDLFVVDGLLPDGMGDKFIEELRKSGNRSPVVFLSAFFRDARSVKFLRKELDVREVLTKPVSAESLLAVVRQALKG